MSSAVQVVACPPQAHLVVDDDDEIDLDDIDAEIEAAAADGAAAEAASTSKHEVENVSTKAVPTAVFGGLADAKG